MDISFISLLLFIIITGVYFTFPSIGKLGLNLSMLQDIPAYYSNNYRRLGLYFMAIVFSQFLLNIIYLVGKCGGSIGGNIGASAMYTFVPWTMIFGSMVAALVAFPGLKTAFSDVVGYFVVSGSANNILNSILVDTDVDSLIDKSGMTSDGKSGARKTAEAIMKLCGNKSIIINQIRPDNFLKMWELLKPLMKPLSPSQMNEKQEELLKLVVRRDNIGEAMWYIYSAILISSIVYYNLASRGCVKSVEEIEKDRNAYLEEQEKIQKKEKINNSVTYTIG
jgi:hypothetical protein